MDPFTDVLSAYLCQCAPYHGQVTIADILAWVAEWVRYGANPQYLCWPDEYAHNDALCQQATALANVLRYHATPNVYDVAHYPSFITLMHQYSCYHLTPAVPTINCLMNGWTADPGLAGLQSWVRDWIAHGSNVSAICNATYPIGTTPCQYATASLKDVLASLCTQTPAVPSAHTPAVVHTAVHATRVRP